MFALPRFVKYSVLALLLSSSALALPAHAVVNNGAPVPEATAQKHKSHHHRHDGRGPEFNMKDRVEARIKDLHDAIGVTPDQESDWSDVAKAMRESEAGVGELIRARHSNMGNTNAIDDIKSYQAISQAHADGMSKFVDAFEPFYSELSPEQKQKADAFFQNFQHRGPGMGPGMHKASMKQGNSPDVKAK